MKVFRDKSNLLRHTNKKISCIATHDQPITINVTQNITDNSVNSMNNIVNNSKYIKCNPTYFKGNKYKVLDNLQSESTVPFLHQLNLDSLIHNVVTIIKKENFNEIKENQITSDILNTNDNKFIKSKIHKFAKLCNKNDLLKNIEPPISSGRSYDDIDNKLRLCSHLVTNTELEECKTEIDEYRKNNTEKFNLYISKILTEALIKNNLNLDQRDNLSIVDHDNKICIKHDNKNLEEFDLDKLNQITKLVQIFVSLIVDGLISNHLIDIENIDFDNEYVINKLKLEFKHLLENFSK
jgi:hypothetical protein